jgi:predicted O-linked N-acetylglucosamine transferase (SPINDLY family)
VFAPVIPPPWSLARVHAADLFLDTHPCSACTVGRDTILAGLPILTCSSGVFSTHHTSSLLHSASVPGESIDHWQAASDISARTHSATANCSTTKSVRTLE